MCCAVSQLFMLLSSVLVWTSDSLAGNVRCSLFMYLLVSIQVLWSDFSILAFKYSRQTVWYVTDICTCCAIITGTPCRVWWNFEGRYVKPCCTERCINFLLHCKDRLTLQSKTWFVYNNIQSAVSWYQSWSRSRRTASKMMVVCIQLLNVHFHLDTGEFIIAWLHWQWCDAHSARDAHTYAWWKTFSYLTSKSLIVLLVNYCKTLFFRRILNFAICLCRKFAAF